MRSVGLYQTAILWGFEYQKEQGLYSTYLGILGAIDENTSDPELKQARIKTNTKYWYTCDKLGILFCLLVELDNSHG